MNALDFATILYDNGLTLDEFNEWIDELEAGVDYTPLITAKEGQA